ncbi:GAF domain-containing protein [Ramlibacter sp. RBP-2]|uniref:histidine kinase n=1 Tax=Ramlibacter lithotrophicus TaxID=2606681 RepID=A0A7X6DBN2_9BURK|nr:ATP-binding protein [Ramlibacter lithotrophicus]NKE64217.1 GAF domain-containing protein [Ramlibacter lithotrophicus]
MAADEWPGGADGGRQRWPPDVERCAAALGEPQQWSQALLTLLGLMRRSGLPTLLAWGPELRLLYNEPFAPVLGTRHPDAFGERMQDVWADAWSTMGPAVQRALAGEACTLKDVPVPAGPGSRGARRWFTLSFTTAYGDDGLSAGVLAVASETTEHVALERRNAFELLLADELGTLTTGAEIAREACRLLGVHLDASRVSYLETRAGAGTVLVVQDWTAGELPSQAGRELGVADFGTRAMAQLRAGRVIRVNDFADEHHLHNTAWDGDMVFAETRSLLAVPLFRGGRLAAVLQVDGSSARSWTDDEVAIATELAQRTWSALEAAAAQERRLRAERELHSAAARQSFQLELADLLRPLTQAEPIIAAASALLGRHLGLSRVLYAEVDDGEGLFRVRSDWTDGQVPSIARTARRKLDDFGPAIIAALRRGETVAVDDVQHDPRTAACAAAYAQVQVRGLVLLPLLQGGRLGIVLNLHQARPRAWRESDLQRARDMAARTWLALDAARAQAALRAERDQGRYVLDTIGEGFLLLDRACRIVQINAEGLRLVQLRAEAAIGAMVWDVWPDVRDGALAGLHQQVVRTAQAAAMEYRRVQPGQQDSWLEVRALPALNGGVAVFYRDIGKRKRAEEQLKEADRRKDEFLATLAHELRNPLAPIATAAKMLALAGLEPAAARRAGEVIARQAGHISRLVDELLDISRIKRGVVALEREVVDLRAIVPDAVEQVQPLLESCRHQLVLDIPPAAAPVFADRRRLLQVLANLLTNAGRYTPAGGRITLALAADPAQVTIAVRDNGIGMTPQLAASAFDLFAQAERSSDRSNGGLGIGLALVRGIVELHGGSVVARSDGPGRGSELVVLLPRADRASVGDAALPAAAKP